MEITAIEEQKKDKNRVSLFLEGEFWIGISINLFQELALRKGDVIDQKEKERIEDLAQEDHAFYWSLNRLSHKQYSEHQLSEKLREKGYPAEIIKVTLEKCREIALLDDTLFAETVAQEKKRKGQGKGRVVEYLKKAGISASLIEAVTLLVFPEEEETEDAHAVLQQKYPDPLNPDQAKKAYNFLLRRGFSSKTCSTLIEKQKMNSSEMDAFYGSDKALALLERKWPDQKDYTEEKAWRFLLYRGFRSEDIREALRVYSSSK